MTNLHFFILFSIFAVIVIVYLHRKGLLNNLCPVCLPITSAPAISVLDQLAIGCVKRLRGIVPESLVSNDDVHKFLVSGNKKVVIVTNMTPEHFITSIQSDSPRVLENINAIVLGSAQVKDLKTFMVMSIKDGAMHPAGSPTTIFNDALGYLVDRIRKDIGAPENNTLLFIDEDIACDGIEKCCGGNRRRYEGLAVLADSEDVGAKFGNSMYDFYAQQ